jgi:hypothetical protein
MIAHATVGAIPINEAKSTLNLTKISNIIEKKTENKNSKILNNKNISKNNEKSGYFNTILYSVEKGFNRVLETVDGLASQATQNTPIGMYMYMYVYIFTYM